MKTPNILMISATTLLISSTAFADTTLYGNFRGSINSVDNGTTDTTSFNNNASRVGIKGATKKGGLTGIYHIQMGANIDGDGTGGGGADEALSDRFYFAGLKGGFGTVIYGRHSTAYKMAGVRLDNFYDTAAGTGFGGANYGLSPLSNGFSNNALAYQSPKIGGAFSLNGAVYLNDSDDQDYMVGGEYKSGGYTGGVQFLTTNNEAGAGTSVANAAQDSEALRVYGGYKSKLWSAGLSYETIDTVGDANEDTYLYVNGSFNVTPKTKLAASYGMVEDTASADGDGYALGVFQKVLPMTTLYALYSTIDFDAAGTGDRDVASMGVVQAF